jgi:hypothetical protein
VPAEGPPVADSDLPVKNDEVIVLLLRTWTDEHAEFLNRDRVQFFYPKGIKQFA